MEYKDLTPIIKSNEERKERAKLKISSELGHENSDGEQYCKEAKVSMKTDTTFCLEKFLEDHKEATCASLTNFTYEELGELAKLVESRICGKQRGKRPKISVKGSIFITLMYYCTYTPVCVLSGIVSVKPATIERIIKRVTNAYFPIFVSRFIPHELVHCRQQFVNFPSAIGAVDSSTIEFYRPKAKAEQKESWDAKNKINGIKLQALVNPQGKAIHICVEYLGGVHDKKLFDVSGLTEFVTIKRGVETVILPILADRGYVGIEHYHKTAIVQQRGNDPETIKRNNFIAKDRQIVERFFGRFKMSWGSMSDGYRGDRDGIKIVVKGLVALTNYNIDLHPLNASDDPESHDITETMKTDVEEDTKISDGSITVHRVTKQHYSLPLCNEFIGIQNQGTTCHLNAVIQVIFQMPFLANAIKQLSNESPFTELSEIFNALKQAHDEGHQGEMAISTKKFTDSLSSSKWTGMQDCTDTFEMIINMTTHSLAKQNRSNDFAKIFTTFTTDKDGAITSWIVFNTYIQYNSIEEAISHQVSKENNLKPPPIFVINIGRNMDKKGQRPDQKFYSFPFQLDLSSKSTNQNKKYDIFAIIAYASLHYIAFIKTTSNWIVMDDENIHYCPNEMITGLFGVHSDDEAKSNSLWMHTAPYKWTARLLFYKEESFSLD